MPRSKAAKPEGATDHPYDPYRTIVFDRDKGFAARTLFFLGVNIAIFVWAFVLRVRL